MGYPDMMRDILAQAGRDALSGRRKALENQPIIDPVTGLYNRAYFDLRLDEELSRSRLYGNRLSLMMIDTGLALRQEQGYENQEEKRIKALSGIVSDCLADTIGLVFLYDQGQFAIILPETGRQEADLTADRIREAILRERLPGVILHAGVVQYKDHENIHELIQAIEDVLYGNR